MSKLGVAPQKPTPELARQVETALGKRPTQWRKPHTGLSPAQRFVVTFEDGGSAFVKAAVDAETERQLRTDHLMMSTLEEDFVPEVLGWVESGERSVLIIEDLRSAYWPADHARKVDGQVLPVRWEPGQWQLLFATLERVASTPAPASLPPLSEVYSPQWPEIVADQEAFLGLEICSARWLAGSIDRLVAAERELNFSGNALVHGDVRSDNVCFLGERVVLVDWSEARRGNARHDLGVALGGCEIEGGPDPYEIMPDGGSFAAWKGAELARRALRETQRAPPWLIKVFKRAAILNFLWAGKCLGLPPWDGPDWRKL